MARLKQGETARNVSCLIWEEDLKRAGKSYGDLLAFLESLNIPCCCSPWHNQDRYTPQDVTNWVDRHIDPDFYDFISTDIETVRAKAPKVGDFKKSHAHVIIKNKGPRNRDYFTKLFRPFIDLHVSKWEKVEHLEAMTAYMCHKNTPTKHRYSELDVHGFGGFDLSPLLKTDKVEKLSTIRLINMEIANRHFRYYHELDDWANETGDMDIIDAVMGRVSYFRAKFASMREKRLDDANAQDSATDRLANAIAKAVKA